MQSMIIDKKDLDLLLEIADRPSLTHLQGEINRIRQYTQAPAQILTAQEAAELLKVHKRTVQNLLKTGELRGTKVGRAWRIHRAEIFRFIDGNSNKSLHLCA